MTFVRTSNVDLKVNGDNAYAFVAQPDDEAKHPGVGNGQKETVVVA